MRCKNGQHDMGERIACKEDIGGVHNLCRRKNIMSSCTCPRYGHFQFPVYKHLVPPCISSVISSKFLTLFGDCFDTRPKKNQTPTYIWPQFRQFGMNIHIPHKDTYRIHTYRNHVCTHQHTRTHTPEATVDQCTRNGSQDSILTPASYLEIHICKCTCYTIFMYINITLYA